MKKTKTVLIGGLLCCILCSNTALAFAMPNEENTHINAVEVFNEQGEISPYTKYYYSASISLYRETNSVKAYISTEAIKYINHIYQDVTVYINGAWYSSERYHAYNNQHLTTTINIPASSGDYIDIYVDNYTQHNGYTEVGHTSQSITY